MPVTAHDNQFQGIVQIILLFWNFVMLRIVALWVAMRSLGLCVLYVMQIFRQVTIGCKYWIYFSCTIEFSPKSAFHPNGTLEPPVRCVPSVCLFMERGATEPPSRSQEVVGSPGLLQTLSWVWSRVSSKGSKWKRCGCWPGAVAECR